MAGEGAIRMGISWVGTSDVWLWVLTSLEVSPVVVNMGRESGIWVSISWVGTSDVWLWVFVSLDELDTHLIELFLGERSTEISPVIMDM